jgi:hypothetical protein
MTCPGLAIVRFHGRNRSTWEAKGLRTSAERFNYLYSDAELGASRSTVVNRRQIFLATGLVGSLSR